MNNLNTQSPSITSITTFTTMTPYNKIIIYILLAILTISLYFIYTYLFTKGNITPTQQKINKISTQPPPACDPEPINNNILADYYISSSANTLNIGKYKYGYISLDMLEKVLTQGARYIEIEICRETPAAGSLPVVAIGEKKGNWIYSLNTLSPVDVFHTITRIGFSQPTNYPLFVNLKLHTDDPITLNELYKVIATACGSKLLNPRKYRQTSLAMEYICNLQNKIILFSFNDTATSKLHDILIPTTNIIKYVSLDDIKNEPLITAKEEKRNAATFDKYFHSRKDITPQTNIDHLFSEHDIHDKITNYNKIALSILTPEPDENYDALELIKYGIQFIAFNYHITGDKKEIYDELFKENRFILKPSGMRMVRKQKTPEDIDKIIINNKIYNNNYIDILRKYEFAQFDASKVYVIRNTANKVLTMDSKNRLSFKNIKTIKLNNCFTFTKTKIPDNDIYVPLYALKNANTHNSETKYLTRTPQQTAQSKYILTHNISNIRNIAVVLLKSNNNYINIATIPEKPYSMEDTTIKILFFDGENIREREYFNGDDALLNKANFSLEQADVIEYANIKTHDGSYIFINTMDSAEDSAKDLTKDSTQNKDASLKKYKLDFTYDADEAEKFVIQKDANDEIFISTSSENFDNKGGIFYVGFEENDVILNNIPVKFKINYNFNTKYVRMQNGNRYITKNKDKLIMEYDNIKLRDNKYDHLGNIIQVAKYSPKLGNTSLFEIISFYDIIK